MSDNFAFMGTGSDVGKSLLVGGFCRMLARRGIKVAPFKAQNMALNSGVTADGLEMGRAQMFQARCAGIEPDVRMNPILLKPQADTRSQIIRMGKALGERESSAYFSMSEENRGIVHNAFDSLCRDYEVILIEGAGSPAEINLYERDITNMNMASYAGADTFIVGDIDRGGVFAWMKGTFDLIPDRHKPLIKGFIINKFRGSYEVLKPGIDMFEAMTGLPVLGTLDYLDINVEQEDSPRESRLSGDFDESHKKKIGIIRLPHLSNFTDFEALNFTENLSARFITTPQQAAGCDAVILPGSKATISDLRWLKQKGLFSAIGEMARSKPVIGICGGYQMMGLTVDDPSGTEGILGREEGLGIFPVHTVMENVKFLKERSYRGAGILEGISFRGYEIHMGTDSGNRGGQLLTGDPGTGTTDGHCVGTYIHGLFDSPAVIKALFTHLGLPPGHVTPWNDVLEAGINTLTDHLEERCPPGMFGLRK